MRAGPTNNDKEQRPRQSGKCVLINNFLEEGKTGFSLSAEKVPETLFALNPKKERL
jgi:hypothetical protein